MAVPPAWPCARGLQWTGRGPGKGICPRWQELRPPWTPSAGPQQPHPRPHPADNWPRLGQVLTGLSKAMVLGSCLCWDPQRRWNHHLLMLCACDQVSPPGTLRGRCCSDHTPTFWTEKQAPKEETKGSLGPGVNPRRKGVPLVAQQSPEHTCETPLA